jgi:hypothetical protein
MIVLDASDFLFGADRQTASAGKILCRYQVRHRTDTLFYFFISTAANQQGHLFTSNIPPAK